MHAKVRVVVAVAILHDHIVTDLKTDAVAVVIPSCHAAERVAVAVLQKDTTSVVAVEVFAVRTVAVERDIFNDHVGRVSRW